MPKNQNNNKSKDANDSNVNYSFSEGVEHKNAEIYELPSSSVTRDLFKNRQVVSANEEISVRQSSVSSDHINSSVENIEDEEFNNLFNEVLLEDEIKYKNNQTNEVKRYFNKLSIKPNDVIIDLLESMSKYSDQFHHDNPNQDFNIKEEYNAYMDQNAERNFLNESNEETLWLRVIHNGLKAKHALYLEQFDNSNKYRFGLVVNPFDVESFNLSELIDDCLNFNSDAELWKDYGARDREYEKKLTELVKKALDFQSTIDNYKTYLHNNEEFKKALSELKEIDKDREYRLNASIRMKEGQIESTNDRIRRIDTDIRSEKSDKSLWYLFIALIVFTLFVLGVWYLAAGKISTTALWAISGTGIASAITSVVIGKTVNQIGNNKKLNKIRSLREEINRLQNQIGELRQQLNNRNYSDREIEIIRRAEGIINTNEEKTDVFGNKVKGLVQNYISSLLYNCNSKLLKNATSAALLTGKIKFIESSGDRDLHTLNIPRIDQEENDDNSKFFKVRVDENDEKWFFPNQIVADYIIDENDINRRDKKLDTSEEKKQVILNNELKGLVKENKSDRNSVNNHKSNNLPYDFDKTDNPIQRSKTT